VSNTVKPVSTNSVLDRIVETGRTILPSGDEVEATGYVDPLCGALLQEVIRAVRPAVAVEVGLAFGISTLYILEALKETGGDKLIGMDPAQHDNHWRGGGMHNIRQAGYESLYEFHESASQQVLPKLAAEGQRIDFAFIDGWHTFDHTLIDFFYIDQILKVGGILVFDDVSYPPIRRVCDFILTNRDYDLYDCVRLKTNNSLSRQVKYVLNRLLQPFIRTDKTPARDALQKEQRIDDVYFLALRKCSDDSRRWDHFVHF
jgi:predicted O-methyltransferase YrrM